MKRLLPCCTYLVQGLTRPQNIIVEQPGSTPVLIHLLLPPLTEHDLGAPLVKHVLQQQRQKSQGRIWGDDWSGGVLEVQLFKDKRGVVGWASIGVLDHRDNLHRNWIKCFFCLFRNKTLGFMCPKPFSSQSPLKLLGISWWNVNGICLYLRAVWTFLV